MPAHGAGLTGVRDVVNTNDDSTIIVLQQNIGDEGVDDEEDGDNVNPAEDENDDLHSINTTPENPLLDTKGVNDGGEQDGVMPDDDETAKGEMTRLKALHSMKRILGGLLGNAVPPLSTHRSHRVTNTNTRRQ